MATERPRFMVSAPEELFKRIEDFRFENRYQARSEAVNELLRLAFEYLAKKQDEDEYLLALAEERLKSDRPLISHDDIWQRLGVTEKDLENVEADEFE